MEKNSTLPMMQKAFSVRPSLALIATISLTSCSPVHQRPEVKRNLPPAATIQIADPDIYPESITSTDAGDVIIGSLAQHYIYRAKPGEAVAQRWIDLTATNSISYGVLADERSKTLWSCTVVNPSTGTRPPPLAQRHSTLRAFDLNTGRSKRAYPLPGPSNSCNDIAIAPDGTPYVSDLGNGRILRLRLKDGTFEEVYAGPEMYRVDGLAFLGNVLYATALETAQIYRLDLDTKPARPQLITLSARLGRPDGLRPYKGHLLLADNGLGSILELTVHGNDAQVVTLLDNLEKPTGVTPGIGRIWFVEAKTNYWDGTGREPSGPNPFTARSLSLTRLSSQ